MSFWGKIRSYLKQPASTARIAFWYVFANVFNRGIAFITTPIFARILSKAEYGQFSNFTSWESILIVIVTMDFGASIARAKYDFNDKMDEYISSILLTSNIVTLFCYVIVELNQTFFVKLFSMDIVYIRLLFIYMLFSPAFTYLQYKHRIYRKYLFFVIFSILSAVIRMGISVALVLLMQDKFLGRILGYVIPISIFNVGLWVVCIVKGKKLSWDCVKYACIISIPLIPHNLSGILLGNSDRIMITNICGAEQNALYSLAYSVSALAHLIWTAMNQAWAPWLYDNIAAGNKKAIFNKSKIYLGVFAALIPGILLAAPELILILGSKAYYEARFIMPPVIMGSVFQFIYGMYVNLEIYKKKTFTISLGTVGAALLNIGLNAVFIPKFGYVAAAYTTLFGYAALFIFHYLIVKKTALDLLDIYDKKYIFLIIAGLLAVSALSLLLYRSNVVRYIILGAYVVAFGYGCFRYRDTILKLFGMKRAGRKRGGQT